MITFLSFIDCKYWWANLCVSARVRLRVRVFVYSSICTEQLSLSLAFPEEKYSWKWKFEFSSQRQNMKFNFIICTERVSIYQLKSIAALTFHSCFMYYVFLFLLLFFIYLVYCSTERSTTNKLILITYLHSRIWSMSTENKLKEMYKHSLCMFDSIFFLSLSIFWVYHLYCFTGREKKTFLFVSFDLFLVKE